MFRDELEQARHRRQRERHLKVQLNASAIISQFFKVIIMLAKCVLTVLELKNTKLNICHHMLTSSIQL